MRTETTWRIPIGILLLLAMLAVYALGVAWLLPLRPFLIWMETGRLRPPAGD